MAERTWNAEVSLLSSIKSLFVQNRLRFLKFKAQKTFKPFQHYPLFDFGANSMGS